MVSQSSHASDNTLGGAGGGGGADHLQDIREEGELASLLVNNTSWLRNLNFYFFIKFPAWILKLNGRETELRKLSKKFIKTETLHGRKTS